MSKSPESLLSDEKLNIILHTSGGIPDAPLFRLGTFFQKRYPDFSVLVPKKAKSAGTLFALSARRIITMGEMAELGPLDMQVRDPETDLWDSALNETKALQTLSREALILYTAKMDLLRGMLSRKSFETRSRIATDFVNEMIKPLVDKIDAVHYTKMARIMEIMKKYGRELMSRAGYTKEKVTKAVEALGEDFPDHSYVIDSIEARRLGLRVFVPRDEAVPLVQAMADICGGTTINRSHFRSLITMPDKNPDCPKESHRPSLEDRGPFRSVVVDRSGRPSHQGVPTRKLHAQRAVPIPREPEDTLPLVEQKRFINNT